MAEHPGATIIREAYEAANRGDNEGMFAALADDIVWHEQTCKALEGDFVGKEALGGFLGGLQARGLTAMRMEAHDILASDDHVVALVNAHMERGEHTIDNHEVHIWHLRGGRATEVWLVSHERDAFDAFWAA